MENNKIDKKLIKYIGDNLLKKDNKKNYIIFTLYKKDEQYFI